MDESDKILSNIFHQKLDEAKIDFNANHSFDALQMKMSLQKFFHFNVRHFNVYYATAIFCCVFFNGILGVQYFKNQKEIAAMKVELNDQKIAFQQLLQSQSLTVTPPNIKILEDSPKKISPAQMDVATKNNDVVTKKIKTEKPLNLPISKADSVNENGATSVVSNNLKAPAKTLYIVKQDTIIQYDSIPLMPRKTKTRRK